MTIVRMSNGADRVGYEEVQVPANTFVPTDVDGATYLEPTWTTGIAGAIPQTEDAYEFAGGAVAEHIQFGWLPPGKWNRGDLRFKIHWARGVYVPASVVASEVTPEPTVQEDVVWRIDLYNLGDHEPIGGIPVTTVRRGDLFYADGVMHITSGSEALTPGGTPALGKRVQIRVTRDVAEENAELLNMSVYFFDLHIQWRKSAAKVAAWS